jgi:hypothetical protein
VLVPGGGVGAHYALMGDVERSRRAPADVVTSFVAGPAYWWEVRAPAGGAERGTALLGAIAFLVVLTIPLLLGRPVALDGPTWVALLGSMTVIGALLLAPSLLWAWGRQPRIARASARTVAVARLVGGVGFAICWLVLVDDRMLLASWPLGVALGAETFLTARVLGVPVQPFAWWRQFLRSGFHLGLLAGFMVLALAARDFAESIALLYAVIHVVVFTAVVTVLGLGRVVSEGEREGRAKAATYAEQFHRARAHWLHDDVSGELRLVRLKLETGKLAEGEVAAELAALDHRLRVRQLDELLRSGAVQVAEIIQPYVRLAVEHGATVVETPRFDDASMVLDEPCGRTMQRAVAILVGNALHAGATTIAIRTRLGAADGQVVLEVEDDAGGFAMDDVPAGRGLDSLRRELAPGYFEVETADRGALVRAFVPLGADHGRAP